MIESEFKEQHPDWWSTRHKINPADYIGERYKHLKIVKMFRGERGGWRVLARCVCGKLKETGFYDLRGGSVVSCGCKRIGNRKAICHPDKKHAGKGLCVACYNRRKTFKQLSPEEIIKIAHEGVCAICATREHLRIDHDHVSGKIRGLLCNEHNLGLGKFKDNPDHLIAAAEYLRRFQDALSTTENL